VDYDPSVQQIAFVNTDTGECGERRLSHSDREAEKFYRELKAAGCNVRVGMEATGHARWFERLQLQAVAMNEGVRRKTALWSKSGRAQLESLWLAPWAARRRHDLLELLDRLNPTIEELSAAVEQQVKHRPEVLRLMTHPGVGPITALAFVLIVDSAERFACGKQIASYVGLIPGEDSSSDRRRLGHIT